MTRQPFDFFIQWHLTEQCNLRCTHCYQSGTRKGELPMAEMRRVIGQVSHMIEAWEDVYGLEFSLSYNITGGEPLLHRDLFRVLKEICDRRGDIYLLTNGTLVTPDAASKLAAHGVKGVQVSIEGPESIHDRIRGQGSFSKALSGIECLLGTGMPVTLNATLSRINAGHVTDFVRLASDLGVSRLGFSRLVPAGRGTGLLSEMLTPEEVRRLYETVFSVQAPGLEIVTGDPVASQMHREQGVDLGDTPVGGCAAGVSGLTFLPDGTITPCRRLPIPIGNIRSDRLREVWAMSDVLSRLRDRSRYTDSCGHCARWADCRGCRAIAYAYAQLQGHDDYLAPDPQCFIEHR